MPFSGGNYSLPAGNPVVSGTTISSTVQNNTMTDIATALSTTLCKDGQSTPTANLPMGGFKLTGIGPGTATGDSLRWQQLFSQGTETDIASAASVDIGGQNTNFLRITGTTTITSFGTNYNGPRFLRFAGAVTLTHNASTLILPGGASITTAAGDTCIVTPVGNPASGWQVLAYQQNQTNTAREQRFTSNGSFTVPQGITTIYASACAGGGGGGGGAGYGSGYIASGGGGGAGQSILEQPYTVTPGQVIAITVGAAGTGGTGGAVGTQGVAGGAGGATSIGSLVTLTGGSGGGLGSVSGVGAGGAGYPAGGDGSGSIATNVGTTVTLYPSGAGGSSPFGGGGGSAAQLAAGSAGKAASGYGAGGSGSSGICGGNSVGAQNGGAGAPGLVVIRW